MSSSLLRPRTLLSVGLLAIPLTACVVKLEDRNAPEVNGAVTGAIANCNAMEIVPKSTLDGPKAAKLVGRFRLPEAADPADPNSVASTDTVFDWSGNHVTFRFQGTTSIVVKLKLTDQVPQDQIFTFVVDGVPTKRQITVKNDAKGAPTNEAQTDYVIDKLSNGPHEVTVWKNTEAQKGGIIFQGIDLKGGQYIEGRRRQRKMEVIGDSIICGYGNEGLNATCPFEVQVRKAISAQGKVIDITVPLTENQYLSFTSQAARELDADVTTICWSGKGVYLNYKEAYRVDPTGALVPDVDATKTIPDLWANRTLASDSTESNYPFDKEKPEDKPQVVFISLGTNDFSRDEEPKNADPSQLPGNNLPDGDMLKPEEYEKFKAKYLEFVKKVRAARPDAHIFVATPPMLTDQFPIDGARSKVRAALDFIVAESQKAGDQKVYAMNLVEMGFRYGLGCDYHPNLEVHQIMAQQLIGAIRTKTCW